MDSGDFTPRPYLVTRLYNAFANGDLCREAAVEIERLYRWRNEAVAVLTLVNDAWERAGCPGDLGQQKWDAMASEIARLRQVVTDQEHQIARLKGQPAGFDPAIVDEITRTAFVTLEGRQRS